MQENCDYPYGRPTTKPRPPPDHPDLDPTIIQKIYNLFQPLPKVYGGYMVPSTGIYTFSAVHPSLQPTAFGTFLPSVLANDLELNYSGFNSQPFEVIWDTGASLSVTAYKEDFLPGTFQPLDTPVQLQGLAAGLQVEGYGTVSWSVQANNGQYRLVQ